LALNAIAFAASPPPAKSASPTPRSRSTAAPSLSATPSECPGHDWPCTSPMNYDAEAAVAAPQHSAAAAKEALSYFTFL